MVHLARVAHRLGEVAGGDEEDVDVLRLQDVVEVVEGFQLLQHDDDHGLLVRPPRVVVHDLAEGRAAAGEAPVPDRRELRVAHHRLGLGPGVDVGDLDAAGAAVEGARDRGRVVALDPDDRRGVAELCRADHVLDGVPARGPVLAVDEDHVVALSPEQLDESRGAVRGGHDAHRLSGGQFPLRAVVPHRRSFVCGRALRGRGPLYRRDGLRSAEVDRPPGVPDVRRCRAEGPVERATMRTDVLVIGAGAAGAAVAWMLARAGIGVVCLEQGDWVDPRAYPHWRADWELHRHTDWSAEPNVRRLPQDYPVNDAGSPIAPLMFNAVGGSTIHWSAHFPRFHPSDFRVRSLDGVADDWPIDYATLEPFFDLNDRMMGVAGLAGDPAYPPKSPRQTPPVPLGTLGATMARGLRPPRLALVAVGQRHHHARLRRPRACINCGPCDLGCPTGRQGEHRHHLLAEGAGVRRAPRDALPRARDHARPGRARRRRALLRRRGAPARAEGARGGRWPPTASARRGCC